MTDKLEPCPFCGEPPERLFVESVTGGYKVHCENCLAEAPYDAWNTRPTASSDVDFDWEDLEDEIESALSDSFDVDWVARDGARHVVGLLRHNYSVASLPSPAPVQDGLVEAVLARIAAQVGESA